MVAAGGRPAARPRRRAQVLLLLLTATGPSARAQELLADGRFLAQPATGSGSSRSVAESADAVGVVHKVGADVFAFPGPDNIAALQLGPSGESRFTIRSSGDSRADGWYRCTGWTYTTAEYTGGTSSELTIDLVDTSDTPLAQSSAYTVALGSTARRDQWIYFDEWVPSNVLETNQARLTFAPGHVTGYLQLAQLSVTFVPFGDRELYDIEVLEMYRTPGRTYDATVSCSLSSLPAAAECPSSYGSGSALGAVDGDIETAYYVSHNSQPIVALEFDLGDTYKICAAMVNYNGGDTNGAWTVKAKGPGANGRWETWATAGGGNRAAGRTMAMAVDSNTPNRFGLKCTDTRHVRIEMESDFMSTLKEITLMKRTEEVMACDPGTGIRSCLHGGKCQADGSCMCPTATAWPYAKTLGHPFGWGGTRCERAACSTSIVCSNDVPSNLGHCGGPNTCRCPAGWHTITGAQQCTTTQCGDGFIVPAGGSPEQCDDGNQINGDGCDSNCQNEPPPPGLRTATRQTTALILRKDIVGANADPPVPPSVVTVAATVGLPVERVCCVRIVPTVVTPDPGEVAYAWTEVYYVSDGADEICLNGGEIQLSNNKAYCLCHAGFSGETCENSMCQQGCDHGSTCIGSDICSECTTAGWEGTRCGTVINGLRVHVVAGAIATAAMLSAASLLVIVKHAYVPIAARGATGIVVSFCGGIVWVLSAAANIQGETFGYDIADASLWQLWIPLCAGAGLWVASSLVYLRTMVTLHVFHHVPTYFLCVITVGIAPWAIACYIESYFAAIFAAGLCVLYLLMLIMQLWSLREDLMDETCDAVAAMLGMSVVAVQLVVGKGGSLGDAVGLSSTLQQGSYSVQEASDPSAIKQIAMAEGSDAYWTLYCSAATVLIVLLHFLTTTAKLCYYAAFKPNAEEIMELYHNEYEAHSGAFHMADTHAKHKEFDEKVKNRRDDHHRHRKEQADEAHAERNRRKLVGTSNSFRDHIKHTHHHVKNAKESITQKAPYSHPKFLDCLSSFRSTHAGGVVSATSKGRKQYGARRKIVPRDGRVVAAKYEQTAAGSKDGHNSDFQSRMLGAGDKDNQHYDKYHKGASKIQSVERGRQARKVVAQKRAGGQGLPGQPVRQSVNLPPLVHPKAADHHHHHHAHHHAP